MSPVVDNMEEISPESPRKMQDKQVVTREGFVECDGWKRRRRVEAGTRRRNGDAGNESFMERGGRRPWIP